MADEYDTAEDYDEEIPKELMISPTTGMPMMDEEEADEKVASSWPQVFMVSLIPRIVFGGIAYIIYFCKKDLYEARMTRYVAVVDCVGWLFLAGGVFGLFITVSNSVPMIWKSGVFPGNAGNYRANMLVYKVFDQARRLPYVMLETEGNIGKYNRSNRALNNLVENGMQVVVAFVLAGAVFGEAVFVLVCLYAVCRIWYQIAYTIGGYGIGCCKHGVPFMFQLIMSNTVEMLVWGAGVRMVALAHAATAA
jgi:uncharacterized MAPEG superfamily protein